jgi:hypothetical protein
MESSALPIANVDRSKGHKAKYRARTTNRPRKMVIDGRTPLGRRIRDLAESYAEQVGGWATLSDMMTVNIRKAAELTALAEKARADALRSGDVDPLALVRLDGAANRAVRALQLDRRREPEREQEQQLADWLKATDWRTKPGFAVKPTGATASPDAVKTKRGGARRD